MILSSKFVFAESLCQKNARDIVLEKNLNFPAWQVETVDCPWAKSKKSIQCFVYGTNGDGAGDRTYLVGMTKDCTKALYVYLIGEE